MTRQDYTGIMTHKQNTNGNTFKKQIYFVDTALILQKTGMEMQLQKQEQEFIIGLVGASA